LKAAEVPNLDKAKANVEAFMHEVLDKLAAGQGDQLGEQAAVAGVA